jgi:hypothetical protein
MTTNEEIRQVVEEIRKALPEKSLYERSLWQGVLDLIEQSEFGKKDASINVESARKSNVDVHDKMEDSSFDRVQLDMLNICIHFLGKFFTSILGNHGFVSIQPHPEGLGARSIRCTFKAKKTSNVATA